MDAPASAHPSIGRTIEELEQPAGNPESRVQNLETTVTLLTEDAIFRNAQLFCLNARYAWAGLFDSWGTADNNPSHREELLKRFVAGMKTGRMLLPTVSAHHEEEARLIPRYMRSCTARWSWGRLLMETRNLEMVRQARDEYREMVRHSSDKED